MEIDPAVRVMGEELRLHVQREINEQPDINHLLAEIVYRTPKTYLNNTTEKYLFWLMVFQSHHYIELTGDDVDINNQFRAAYLVIGVSLEEVSVEKNRWGDTPMRGLHMADPKYFEKFGSMLVEILA